MSSIEVTKITSRFLIVEVNFEVLRLDSLIWVIARMLLVIRSIVAVSTFSFQSRARLTNSLIGEVVCSVALSTRRPVGDQTGVLGAWRLFDWLTGISQGASSVCWGSQTFSLERLHFCSMHQAFNLQLFYLQIFEFHDFSQRQNFGLSGFAAVLHVEEILLKLLDVKDEVFLIKVPAHGVHRALSHHLSRLLFANFCFYLVVSARLVTPTFW